MKKKPTQKNRSLTERRELWLYYTRLRSIYSRAKHRVMVERISGWRSSLAYRMQSGDMAALRSDGDL